MEREKKFLPLHSLYGHGAVAQVVEQWTENPCVVGSTPTSTTKNRTANRCPVFLVQPRLCRAVGVEQPLSPCTLKGRGKVFPRTSQAMSPFYLRQCYIFRPTRHQRAISFLNLPSSPQSASNHVGVLGRGCWNQHLQPVFPAIFVPRVHPLDLQPVTVWRMPWTSGRLHTKSGARIGGRGGGTGFHGRRGGRRGPRSQGVRRDGPRG